MKQGYSSPVLADGWLYFGEGMHEDQNCKLYCIDAANGAMAARLWWMLRWVGHDAVAVLDGGFAKWSAEGRPVSADVPKIKPTEYRVQVRPDMTLEKLSMQFSMSELEGREDTLEAYERARATSVERSTAFSG